MALSLLLLAACTTFAVMVTLPPVLCRYRGHLWRMLDANSTRVCQRCHRVEYWLGGRWVASFDGA